MKNLMLFLVLTLPVAMIGQVDCSKVILKEPDKMTGNSYIYAEPIILEHENGKSGIAMNWLVVQKVIVLNLRVIGASNCIDKGDKINILFTDGDKLELQSESDFNCEQNSTVYFGGLFRKKDTLAKLGQKKIEALRAWTEDGYVEVNIPEEQQIQIMNAAGCIAKEK